eukprot:GFYU01035313.1.p1 GENE.GFYU01035313.1~~GFYU01035313.1.p1  ORF type:complete len:436 (-),score=138.36 GFYU01035313.1:81-1262(-)
MMNESIRARFDVSNPFIFKHISNLKSIDHFDDNGPCVVMASPGMLQNGLSRELFEKWCPDKRNGVIVPGYTVEGTLAKHILSGDPTEITSLSGLTLPLRMSVHYISFSAHSDYVQTSEFIDSMQPPNVVLVHGDANEMGRLKQALLTKYEEKNVKVLSPKNCQAVELEFRGEKMAKTVGSLAEKKPVAGMPLSGLLVKKEFNYHILAPRDLHTYTQLQKSMVTQKQSVQFAQPFHVLQHHLELMFDSVEPEPLDEDLTKLWIGELSVEQTKTNIDSAAHVIVEWSSTPVNDMVADSIMSVVMQLDVSPTASKFATKTADVKKADDKAVVEGCLKKHFDAVEMADDGTITVTAGPAKAVGSLESEEVECSDANLQSRFTTVLRRLRTALLPLPM